MCCANIDLDVGKGERHRDLRSFGLGQIDADPLHQTRWRNFQEGPHRRRRAIELGPEFAAGSMKSGAKVGMVFPEFSNLFPHLDRGWRTARLAPILGAQYSEEGMPKPPAMKYLEAGENSAAGEQISGPRCQAGQQQRVAIRAARLTMKPEGHAVRTNRLRRWIRRWSRKWLDTMVDLAMKGMDHAGRHPTRWDLPGKWPIAIVFMDAGPNHRGEHAGEIFFANSARGMRAQNCSSARSCVDFSSFIVSESEAIIALQEKNGLLRRKCPRHDAVGGLARPHTFIERNVDGAALLEPIPAPASFFERMKSGLNSFGLIARSVIAQPTVTMVWPGPKLLGQADWRRRR